MPADRTPREMRAYAESPGGWEEVADARTMLRYSLRSPGFRHRCRVGDGCRKRATHAGMVNGLCMASGCEFHVAQWVKAGQGG